MITDAKHAWLRGRDGRWLHARFFERFIRWRERNVTALLTLPSPVDKANGLAVGHGKITETSKVLAS